MNFEQLSKLLEEIAATGLRALADYGEDRDMLENEVVQMSEEIRAVLIRHNNRPRSWALAICVLSLSLAYLTRAMKYEEKIMGSVN